MIEFSVLGDRSVEGFLREVVTADIPANDDGVPSKVSDFLHNKLSFLFLKVSGDCSNQVHRQDKSWDQGNVREDIRDNRSRAWQ